MTDKGLFKVIKLTGVPTPLAQILKMEMLAKPLTFMNGNSPSQTDGELLKTKMWDEYKKSVNWKIRLKDVKTQAKEVNND